MIRNEVSIKGKFSYRQGGWKYSRGIRYLLFVGLAVLFYVGLSGKLVPETYDIKPNTVSEKTIYAPKQIENAIETQKAKEEAAARVQPVHQIMSTRNEQIAESLFEKLNVNNADNDMKFDTKVSLYKDVFPSVLKDYTRQLLSTLARNAQYNDKLITEVESKMADQMYRMPEEAYYKLPRLTKEDLAAMEPVTREIVARLMNDQIMDAQTARAKVTELVNSSILSKNTQRELAQEIARYVITPNKFYDAKGTEEARAQARENTPPVYINKGDVVVAKGDLISDEIYQRLDKLDLLKDKVNYWPQLGLLLLVSMFVVVLYLFSEQGSMPAGSSNIQLAMLAVIVAITLVTLKIISIVQPAHYPFAGFLAPVSMGCMLIVLLLDIRLAFLVSVLFSISASVVFNNLPNALFDFRYGLVTLVACFTAILSLNRASQRSTILKAGILVSLMTMVAILALFLLENNHSPREITFAVSFALAGGLLTAVFVIGLMPFFETAFGILSPLKLVELSNPNHPLLRKLLTETPGTYHHSIMVGNLAEAAAEAVGADGLLCRVGSYYHDIGKTKRPSYFIENQQNIENPHDNIDPALSKSIIVAHARDGVEMLKEYKMPKPIRDIAEQHHGTTLLKFFYHKAKQQHAEDSDKKVLEEDYRYPGPRAQSKEAAIVGVADSVEAAVRSLRNPTVEQIDGLVQRIIKGRLDDDQFNECDLTLKELDIIGKALKETLLGIFHSRIEYPSELPSKNDKG